MLPPFLAASSLMEREKSRSRRETDELALVKAAAWAWYQHSSGSLEGKQMREHGVARTLRYPGPSRYRQESMKLQAELASHTEKEGNSLMDSYELELISRQLGQFMNESPASKANRDGYNSHGKARYQLKHQDVSMSQPDSESGPKKQKKKEKKKKKVGFWERHGVVCGTREDVVEAAVFRDTRLRCV